ncbi:hypothetical protein NFC73_11430 [Pseudarthrobacter sp. RMG13]|uniref:Uncharacterized protein n=1 Tax=Pseudarthrobacter humi TaxID=2952523 RepID=A0ABT1LPE5_9MICC|nr:hypothetical protein [Pseudarthrobacter humi]MCP9000335.1 hypothetical protein [Pseudarthrobacter humi]
MDALWGLLGVLLGGALTIGGNLLLSDREAAEAARNEKKLAYLALLTSARKLRYLSRQGRNRDIDELDADRTQLSTANYEIELLATRQVASSADQLRRSTLDYLNLARKSYETDVGPTLVDRVDDLAIARRSARMANDVFIEAARSDLQRKLRSSRLRDVFHSLQVPNPDRLPEVKTRSVDAD